MGILEFFWGFVEFFWAQEAALIESFYEALLLNFWQYIVPLFGA